MTTTSVSAGQASFGIMLSTGNALNGSAGGTADSTVISGVDLEIVRTGGSASGTQVNGGEALPVLSDRSTVTPVSADGGPLDRNRARTIRRRHYGRGSTTISVGIGAGEIECILASGVASATTVSNGGSVVVVGGLIETSLNRPGLFPSARGTSIQFRKDVGPRGCPVVECHKD